MFEVAVEIAGIEMIVEYDFKITCSGCRAHMGSLSYAGHAAEPAEFEITVYGIRFPKQAADVETQLPEWLKDLLTTHLSERDDVSDMVQKVDMERDYFDGGDY